MLELDVRPAPPPAATGASPPPPAPAAGGRRASFPTGPVLATIATLGLALAWQLATISHGGHSSLSDVPRVLLHRGIGPGAVPYLDRVLEYPVGAGVLLYLATLIAPGPVGALVVTAIAASVAAVVVTVLLARRDGARVWRWALASPLLLFAFQNWDVFAVLALVAGLIAFERRRPATAGVLLGIGTAIKLFPIVAVPLLAASAWSHRDRRSAVRVTVAALATVALANLPFALANPTGWWWTTSFQGARPATWGSAWLHLYDLLGLPTHGVAAAHLANAVSLVALAAGTVALAAVTVRRRLPPVPAAAAAVALLLLTNKVYSPTYDLWLVPFFVMVPALSRRLWLSFCAVDLAIYAAVYGYLHHVVAPGPVHQVLPVLVSIRTVVLVVVIVRALRPVAARVRPVTAPQPHDSFVRTQLARPLVGRLARCMSVSVLTTVFSLVSLVVLTTFGMAAMLANVLTTTVATIPSYHLNRRWTWSKRGSSDPWREVVPFWLLAFAGLALSTVTVGIADRWAAGAHLDGVLRTGAVLGGHLGGFALLWVAQFVVLDRVLFRHRDARPPSGAYPAGVVD